MATAFRGETLAYLGGGRATYQHNSALARVLLRWVAWVFRWRSNEDFVSHSRAES